MNFFFDDEKLVIRFVGVNVDLEVWLIILNVKVLEVRKVMQEVLYRSVKIVGVSCDFKVQIVDIGVQYIYQYFRFIGVGDEFVDKFQILIRIVGVEVQFEIMFKVVNIDYGWKVDFVINIVKFFIDNKGVQFEKIR